MDSDSTPTRKMPIPKDLSGKDRSGLVVTADITTELSERDLIDLCDATDLAIVDGGGFGWLKPPERHILERYWQGVMVVPERTLLIGRLDSVVAGSVQLQRQPKNNEAQSFCVFLTSFFVAPWARGYGVAKTLLEAVEQTAIEQSFEMIRLDVRETQDAAIKLYKNFGYTQWARLEEYAKVDGKYVSGLFFQKKLEKMEPQ